MGALKPLAAEIADMFKRLPSRGVAFLLLLAASTTHPARAELTEADFFFGCPGGPDHTRLAQSLFETPGAVTVLDRRAIQASGARTLVDLLRLVPGYMVSGYSGAMQLGAYHAPIDEFGTRNLVLVDGRSVYSTTYLGGTIRGMASVLLEDVERVEVLRGSNSAAYGANAMFGVINVITRHAQDTQGPSVMVRRGGEGVADAHARIGWQSEAGSHRLSLGSRRDDGYRFVNDTQHLTSLQWRSDIRLNAQEELFLSGSLTQSRYGDGAGPPSVRPSDPDRTISWQGIHLQARWKQQLSGVEQQSFFFSWDETQTKDQFTVNLQPFPVLVDFSSRDRRLHAEYQHQLQPVESLRLVWGGNYKEDSAVAPPLFFKTGRVSKSDVSVFVNAEWSFAQQWLLNAGLFAGHNSLTGSYANPRLMFNVQLAPQQTLRFGWSTAQRAPTLFERFSDVRYFNSAGNFVRSTYFPSPGIQSETLTTREISYLAYSPQWGLELDVRVYDEQFDREIIIDRRIPSSRPRNFINRAGFDTQGVEYQFRWSPSDQTTFIWNQNFNRFRWDVPETKLTPRQFGSVAWLQSLPDDWQFSLWVHYRDRMAWRDRIEADTRVDLHVARDFRWGHARATGALTIQSLNGDRVEFTANQPSVFPRRAFATLHVEF